MIEKIERVSKPGLRIYKGRGRYPAGDERARNRHRLDLARRDDRSQGARHRRRRRSAVHRRVTGREHVPHRQSTSIKLPPKVEVNVGGRARSSVKGPLGRSSRQFGDERSPIEKNGDTLVFKAASEEAKRDARHAARAGREHGQGRDRRLREETGAASASAIAAQAAGDKLNLSLGFSHPVVHRMPKGVKAETPLQTGDRHQGHRQAAGRAGRGGDPRLPSARAVQGQGCALRRRAGRDQRDEEEVSEQLEVRSR